MNTLPQELEIWYLIPALRSELARIFISDFKLSQKQVSKILGITESAVSQYLSSKRGNELKFNKKELEEIKKTAQKILKSKKAKFSGKTRNFSTNLSGSQINEEFYKLCIKLRGTESLCALHRKHDKSISKKCEMCCQ